MSPSMVRSTEPRTRSVSRRDARFRFRVALFSIASGEPPSILDAESSDTQDNVFNYAKAGSKIPDLSAEHVCERLADERDPKAIERLTAAREYLAGLSPEDIEEKYGWDRQTVYNWLDQFLTTDTSEKSMSFETGFAQ